MATGLKLKRRTMWPALLVIVALVMASCSADTQGSTTTQAAGPTTTGDGTSGTTATTAAETEPTTGGTLITALSADPAHLNGAITTDVAIALPGRAMLDGLIRINRSKEVVPALAESIDISDDGLTYTFHLRSGVTWHDGEPFDADDVLFTFENALPLNSSSEGLLEFVESIEAPDPLTVVITLNEPFAPFLATLAPENVSIIPEHIFGDGADLATHPMNMSPIGTGPFKFKEWRAGEAIILERYDGYWDAPKPYLDQLIFSIVPDSNSAVQALRAGEIDFIVDYDLPFTEVPALEEDGQFYLEAGRDSPSLQLLFFNHLTEPLDNPAVRKAMFTAIDRDLFVDAAFLGLAEPGTSSIPPIVEWAYDPSVDYMDMYAFDIAAADAMLDEAGITKDADGHRFTLDMPYTDSITGAQEFVDIARSAWAELGIELNLEPLERTVWIERIYTDRDFDVTYASYAARSDPVLGIHRAYTCDEERGAFGNPSGYCNPELEELFAQAATTVDVEDRAAVYSDIQHLIADELPAAVVADSLGYDAIVDKFDGIEEFMTGSTTVPVWKELIPRDQ